MFKSTSYLIRFSAFLLVIAIISPISSALVVAPVIAVGLLHFISWILSLLAIPVAVFVRLIGRVGYKKVVFITLAILSAIGILIYAVFFIFNTYTAHAQMLFLPQEEPTNVVEKPYKYDAVGVPAPDNTETTDYISLVGNFLPLYGVLIVLFFFPTLFTLIAINTRNNTWTKFELLLLTLAVSATFATLVSAILLVKFVTITL